MFHIHLPTILLVYLPTLPYGKMAINCLKHFKRIVERTRHVLAFPNDMIASPVFFQVRRPYRPWECCGRMSGASESSPQGWADCLTLTKDHGLSEDWRYHRKTDFDFKKKMKTLLNDRRGKGMALENTWMMLFIPKIGEFNNVTMQHYRVVSDLGAGGTIASRKSSL